MSGSSSRKSPSRKSAMPVSLTESELIVLQEFMNTLTQDKLHDFCSKSVGSGEFCDSAPGISARLRNDEYNKTSGKSKALEEINDGLLETGTKKEIVSLAMTVNDEDFELIASTPAGSKAIAGNINASKRLSNIKTERTSQTKSSPKISATRSRSMSGQYSTPSLNRLPAAVLSAASSRSVQNRPTIEYEMPILKVPEAPYTNSSYDARNIKLLEPLASEVLLSAIQSDDYIKHLSNTNSDFLELITRKLAEKTRSVRASSPSRTMQDTRSMKDSYMNNSMDQYRSKSPQRGETRSSSMSRSKSQARTPSVDTLPNKMLNSKDDESQFVSCFWNASDEKNTSMNSSPPRSPRNASPKYKY